MPRLWHAVHLAAAGRLRVPLPQTGGPRAVGVAAAVGLQRRQRAVRVSTSVGNRSRSRSLPRASPLLAAAASTAVCALRGVVKPYMLAAAAYSTVIWIHTILSVCSRHPSGCFSLHRDSISTRRHRNNDRIRKCCCRR